MKAYLIALAVGMLVGVIYGLLNVRSPAPPIVALVGLLGILVGEQLVPLARQALAPRAPMQVVPQARTGDAVAADRGSGPARVAASPAPAKSSPPSAAERKTE